ncbi:MAG: hypothetical protein K2Q97_13875 [Burkholderiaceae bacterium]|nr:hypothetical protein [Burkholderiaceae bacterium]
MHGALEFAESGVFLAFEERPHERVENMALLGFDLQSLVRDGKKDIDHVPLDQMQFEAVDDFNLEGLFVRLGHAVKRIGARRVVIDTLENLFGSLPNESLIRTELQDIYLGKKGYLTGAARMAQEARDVAQAKVLHQDTEQRQRAIERKCDALDSRIAAIRAEFAVEKQEALVQMQGHVNRVRQSEQGTDHIGQLRGADATRVTRHRA